MHRYPQKLSSNVLTGARIPSMNLMSLIKREDRVDRDDDMDVALEELQAGVAEAVEESLGQEFEAALPAVQSAAEITPPYADELDSDELVRDDLDSDELDRDALDGDELAGDELADRQVAFPVPSSEPMEPAANAVEPATDRLTSHAHSRLAALESFETLYNDARDHLRDIDAKLSEITNSHQLTRKFFG